MTMMISKTIQQATILFDWLKTWKQENKDPKKMRRLGIIANYQFKNNQNVAV